MRFREDGSSVLFSPRQSLVDVRRQIGIGGTGDDELESLLDQEGD